MKPGFLGSLLLGAAVALVSSGAGAATIWDESVNGDFSGSGLAPTALVATTGHNVVIGTTGNAGQGIDQDYFRITVPTGALLTGIFLLDNTFVSGGSSFAGMEAGPQVTTGNGSSLLGFVHYDNAMIGTNMLSFLSPGTPAGLPGGTYSLWVQETGGPVSYGFDFVIAAPVPEASTWAMLISGFAGVGFLAYRRRSNLAASMA